MEHTEKLEIVNDVFYVKKETEKDPCKFAYLHLSEDLDDVFAIYFENREVAEGKKYRWNETDSSDVASSRQFIKELISEAYLSLYLKKGIEKWPDKPLWKHTIGMNSGIPSSWWSKVKEMNV